MDLPFSVLQILGFQATSWETQDSGCTGPKSSLRSHPKLRAILSIASISYHESFGWYMKRPQPYSGQRNSGSTVEGKSPLFSRASARSAAPKSKTRGFALIRGQSEELFVSHQRGSSFPERGADLWRSPVTYGEVQGTSEEAWGTSEEVWGPSENPLDCY